MIILKKLQWSNCFSYGKDNVLDLEADILTQLVGTNGAGKSSIPLLVEEALFNKNSKGIKKTDIVNRHNGAKYYSISLDFSTDGSNYTIDVNRSTSLKVKLMQDGEDISSHTATGTFKTLELILGLDFKTFSQLVYQSTTNSLQFLTATDTNRKKFLIDLLNLDNYIKYFDTFKVAHKEVQDQLNEIKGEINNIEQWLNHHKISSNTKKKVRDLPVISTEEIEEVSELQLRLKNLHATNRSIAQNEQYKELLVKIDANELVKVVLKPEDPEDINAKIGSLTAERAAAKTTMKKLNALDGKLQCPTCLQDIEEDFKAELEAEANSSISSKITEINKLNDKVTEIREQNQEYSQHQSMVREFERLSTLIDRDLSVEPEDELNIQEQINGLQHSISSLQAEISKIEKENREATKFNTELEYLTNQIKEFKENLDKKQSQLKNIVNESANLEVLKKSFSTNGLVAYKIENLVKDLEEIANIYLSELSDGRFQLTFEVTNDKLNVVISDNGDTIQILALSSGELARVNTATLLAIRKLMATLSKSKINMLFLDEVINVLDDPGREKLIETLLKEVELNTFLVSHGYTHPLLSKINVVKIKDTSRLEQ
jgi:DNA repair exonuclease SbcCD ATPase subunit